MTAERLPETTQTLYAELLEQSIHAQAETGLAGGAVHGTFVSKTVKGGIYWYLQRQEGDRKRQHYLGRESPELLAWLDEVRQLRDRAGLPAGPRRRGAPAPVPGLPDRGPDPGGRRRRPRNPGQRPVAGPFRPPQALALATPAGLRADEGGEGPAPGQGSSGGSPGGSARRCDDRLGGARSPWFRGRSREAGPGEARPPALGGGSSI